MIASKDCLLALSQLMPSAASSLAAATGSMSVTTTPSLPASSAAALIPEKSESDSVHHNFNLDDFDKCVVK